MYNSRCKLGRLRYRKCDNLMQQVTLRCAAHKQPTAVALQSERKWHHRTASAIIKCASNAQALRYAMYGRLCSRSQLTLWSKVKAGCPHYEPTVAGSLDLGAPNKETQIRGQTPTYCRSTMRLLQTCGPDTMMPLAAYTWSNHTHIWETASNLGWTPVTFSSRPLWKEPPWPKQPQLYDAKA